MMGDYCGGNPILGASGPCWNRDCEECHADARRVACPMCNGSGIGPVFAGRPRGVRPWGECVLCAGAGTVALSLARLVRSTHRGKGARP